MANEAPLCISQRTVPDLDRGIQRGIVDRTYSAAASVASVKGGIFHRGAYGTALMPPSPQRVSHETLFDLGNLTMPLAGGVAALLLISRHRLDLGATVASVLQDFAQPPFTQITIDMLLDHTSGLPATANLWQSLQKSDKGVVPGERLLGSRRAETALRQALAAVPMEAPPGTQAVQSELGFLLLGWVLEAVVGKPLDTFLQQEIYGPLGLADELFFVRVDGRRDPKKVFAATEQCPWRGKKLQGEVMEPNAWAIGGVAANAGLFGTASAVWRLCATLLQCLRGENNFFHTGTLMRFWTRTRRVQTTRTLGWDTPTVLNSSAGKRLSRTSVGHTSEMGNCFWIDTAGEIIGVTLANAAHLSLKDKAKPMQKIWTRTFDLIASNASLGPPPPDADEAWARLVAQTKR